MPLNKETKPRTENVRENILRLHVRNNTYQTFASLPGAE